ncbi:MAG: hypothetical protein MUF34_15485 [Polyangiaceae bacterium]|nr:hypothetical protein [Polyangiaceae bacterium]
MNALGARLLVRDAVVGTKLTDRPIEVSLNEGRARADVIGEGYQSCRKEHTLKGGSSLELEIHLDRQAAATTMVEKTKTI